MITQVTGKCAWEGCTKKATTIAAGRKYFSNDGHQEPACYCDTHADNVADEGSPEYIECCPNCGCKFGVN